MCRKEQAASLGAALLTLSSTDLSQAVGRASLTRSTHPGLLTGLVWGTSKECTIMMKTVSPRSLEPQKARGVSPAVWVTASWGAFIVQITPQCPKELMPNGPGLDGRGPQLVAQLGGVGTGGGSGERVRVREGESRDPELQ